MAEADQPTTDTTSQQQASETTDGFHLVIDALKLNDINTIFGLVGIPITDLARLAQAEGMRFIGFRHEQHAGNAAAISGYITQKPGICLTVSAPGFLNGLTALANATTNCFPMILISGSSEREIVDLQQGDYEEMDQLNAAKPYAKAAYRVLHAEDIGIGVARAIRAAVSGRPGGVYLDLPAKLLAQTLDTVKAQQSLVKVVDAAPRQLPAPESVKRALDVLKSAKRPLILLGKGAAYAQADAEIRAFVEQSGIPYLPMSMAKGLLPDTHEQSASAARSFVLQEADVVVLIGARLNWLLSHGKGNTWGAAPKKFVQVDISPTEIDSNVAIAAPVIGDIGSCVAALRAGLDASFAKPERRMDRRDRRAQEQESREDGRDARQEPVADEFPQCFACDSRRAEDAPGHQRRQRRREHARLRAQHYRHGRAAQALRFRHVGNHGYRHGLRDRRGGDERQAGGRDRRRQRVRVQRHGTRNDLPLRVAGLHDRIQQQRRVSRHRREPDGRQGRRAYCVREGCALRQDDRGVRRHRLPRDARRKN